MTADRGCASALRRRRRAAPRAAFGGEKKATLPNGKVGNAQSADRGKWGGGDSELSGDELNRALAFYPMTDLGNAERCVQRFRHA
jgi:hypothetical protein